MKGWCRRHAGLLALGFGITTAALIVVVVLQAAMLHTRGWWIALGTVPEWLSGVGALATFAAVWVAVKQLSIGQAERTSLENERTALANTREAERRDHEMSQARLIIIEPVRTATESLPAWRKYGELLVHNHSAAPVFDLLLEFVSPIDEHTTVEELTSDDTGNPCYRPAQNRPVLPPDQATAPFFVTTSGNKLNPDRAKYVAFRFTDARGLRWRRIGGEQPVQLLNDVVPLTPVTIEPIEIQMPEGFRRRA